jgi:hypothetical protein
LRLYDVLRVDEGRYWSYLCADSVCCPPEGVPVDGAHPAALTLTVAGISAAPSRAALAATIVPVTGPDADAMRQATAAVERATAEMTHGRGWIPSTGRLTSGCGPT